MKREVEVAIWVAIGFIVLLVVCWLAYRFIERRIIGRAIKGLSPEDAKKKKEEIKKAIDENGRKIREKIKSWWQWQKTIIMLSVLVGLDGCTKNAIMPEPPIPKDFEELVSPLEKQCKPQSETKVLCPTADLKKVLIGSSEFFDRMLVCERTVDIAAQEMAWKVDKAEQERDSERTQKYIWASVSAAAATIITILICK